MVMALRIPAILVLMIRVVDNDSTEHYGNWAWRCSLALFLDPW